MGIWVSVTFNRRDAPVTCSFVVPADEDSTLLPRALSVSTTCLLHWDQTILPEHLALLVQTRKLAPAYCSEGGKSQFAELDGEYEHILVKSIFKSHSGYSTIKKNEKMPSAATWMDLEMIILSEGRQIEKDKYHIISLIGGI